MREFYKDKSIMLTGCTGFLGKIILEKILRTCSNFRKVYILIRPKKGTTVAKRLQYEIFSSPLFTILFKSRPEVLKIVKERVIAVQGDLVMEELGMSPSDRAMLVNDLDLIINSAASIDF